MPVLLLSIVVGGPEGDEARTCADACSIYVHPKPAKLWVVFAVQPDRIVCAAHLRSTVGPCIWPA
jgi:hypothetical protein